MRENLKRLLSGAIPTTEFDYVYNPYDIVGDIAIIRVREASGKYCALLAQAIRRIHNNANTVLAQVSSIRGDFRLRAMKHINGEDRAVSAHKESGCLFAVGVERCYF